MKELHNSHVSDVAEHDISITKAQNCQAISYQHGGNTN